MSDKHEDIEGLLRLAGPRDAVPRERTDRVKHTVRAYWREQARARARTRTIAWSSIALVATALLIVGIRVMHRTTPADPGLVVGTSDTSGESLRAGSLIETTAARFHSLRMSSGVGVRIDANSRLRVLTDSAVELEQGRIYVDAGAAVSPSSSATALEVHTRFGVARDVGTTFQVQIDQSFLKVSVREGDVELRGAGQLHRARRGEEVTLDAVGRVARRRVPVYGPEWEWAFAVGEPFAIEGRSLREFLEWIAGENGWEIQFADRDIEQKSSITILHGSIQGLSPAEALATVLPVSGVPYQFENGVLRVGQGTGGSQD